MNIMKKKPELLKKTGKSSQTLFFVNNLKENDLHYENKQITQCVFLGVLRLKPVPSIFSNNVPSVSTTAETNKPKKIKNNNSNKELNKNASKKHNISKVLSGKISKKNPEKIKAAVKKVPIKKPNIKIKLNTKKKINEAEPSTSNGKQETLPSGTLSTVSPDSIIARSTLTLNPVISPTKFNPVQNLFDKLKQRREERQNEAGPSKITAQSSNTELLKSTETRYKVCKINANVHNTPNVNSCKKLKKSYKKSHERLTLPLISTSPITVSDTESIGKKDSDIILLDENNSNNSDSSDNGIVEDVIIINDDSRPKNTESTLDNQEIIDTRIHNNSFSTLTNVYSELVDTNQCQEVIVISDEPKQRDKSEGNNTRSEKNENIVTSKTDVIVIDEVREIRVSPRFKKVEEKANEITTNIKKTVVDELVVPDENKISSKVPKILQDSVDISKTQELNITIENRQTENKKLKTSPRLLKIVDKNKDISVTVKKELIEDVVVVNEKPKRRKNTMRSPTLLPPMLLNAPMLLRSELAPKKPNYVNEKTSIRKPRNKIKDPSKSKSVISVTDQVKDNRDESTKLLIKTSKALQLETSRFDQEYSETGNALSPTRCYNQSDEIICVDDSKIKSTSDRGVIKKLQVTQHKNVNNIKIENVQETSCPQHTQNKNLKESRPKMGENENVRDVIILNDEKIKSEVKTRPKETRKHKIKIFNRKPLLAVSTHKEEDVVIVKEENISPRLLRSDLLKQKKLTETININLPVAERVESEVNEFANLIDTSEVSKRISPRTHRSNIKNGPTNRNSSADNTIIIKDEEASAQNDEIIEKLPETDKSQQKIKRVIQKTKQVDLNEIIILNDRRTKKPKEKHSSRLLRSELSQLSAKEKLPVKTELEEIIVLIHDEPKDKQKSAVLPLQSNVMSSDRIENVIIVPEEERNQIEVRSPRSLRSDRVRKANAEVTSPTPRTSEMVKMGNNSLPNSYLDQQPHVDDLTVISQRSCEKMENVIVVPEEQTNETEVRSPRSLRSDRVRKVDLEVTSAKSRTSRMGKMESNSIPNVSNNQLQVDVDGLHVIPQKNAEQIENVIVVPDEQRNQTEVQSPRSLRSDRVQKVNLDVPSTKPRTSRTIKIENSSIDQNLDVDNLLIISQRTLEQMENVIVVPDEQRNQTEVQSPRSLRSDRVRKVNLDVPSTKPRTSRTIKIENSSIDQNLDVDNLLIISQRTLEQMENVIVVPDEQRNPIEVQSPRSLRSDRVRKVNSEVTSPKSRTSTILKMDNIGSLPTISIDQHMEHIENVIVPEEEKNQMVQVQSPRSLRSDKVGKVNLEVPSKPLPNSSTGQQLDVADVHVISQTNSEQALTAVPLIKVERRNSSHRLLRSETVRKDLSENVNVNNANIDNIVTSPRLLRSEMFSLKNSQSLTKEQSLSPNTIKKTRTPQKGPQSCKISNTSLQADPKKVMVIQNELLENQNFNKTALENANGVQKTEMEKPSESSVAKKSRKRRNKHSQILASSKKVLTSKKKRFHKRKSAPKTSMLLRSELAQLKTVTNSIKPIEKKISRKKAKCKGNNVSVKDQLLENSTVKLQSKHKKKKSLQTKIIQDGNDGSKSGKYVEMIDFKKDGTKNTIPVQSMDNNSEVLGSSNDHVSKSHNVCQNEIAYEISSTEATIIIEEHKNRKNSPTRRNTSYDILHGDIVQSEDVTIKKKSPGIRKKNKRKRKMKSEEEQKYTEEQVQHQDIQEENEKCDIISKKADITVFDFDESEPEVLPLRLNSTPKKEKSVVFTNKASIRSSPSEGNVTPNSKKQRVADEPVTKAQAKVQLLAVFNESSTQKKDLDIPANPDKNKTKPTSKKKTVRDQLTQEEWSCPQNENVKKKRGRPKVSPNKTNTPQSSQSQDIPNKTPRTSNSPLKQTTITDMFNVMMKKEKKSSVDSVFEAAPKETPLETRRESDKDNTKTDMPPPRLDRKPVPNEEEEEYYEDDSDCESRMEWIPEEYAEYKFKYSAKKMMTYKPIHKCKICLLILPTYYKLSKHKEEHAKKQNPYNCKQCEQSFSNVEDLTAHLRVHKGKHPYTCKKCDVGFWSKKSLDAHTPIHVLRKVKQPNKRFRCDVCAKEFSKLCDMERHTRVHTGEKPCICNICNKRFQQSHNLSKHLLTHLHVKPFHCEICNKQFGRNDVLNRHLLTHSVEKPIKCPLCSKGFIRQSQLNNHMKKNHLDAAKIGASAELKVAEAK